MKISILTPTYNRANLLDKLYASILINSNNCSDCEVEWLVMDDGSTDKTKKLVDGWISEGKLEIKYMYQKNAGKMAAHNLGVKECDTELFLCCDSDDWMAENSIKTALDFWNAYQKELSGMVGPKRLHQKELSGMVGPRDNKKSETNSLETLPKNEKTDTLSGLYKKGYFGETALFFKTSVIRQYPFPVIDGEKFIPEGYVYRQLDDKYELLIYPAYCMDCEYQEDGYTNNGLKLRVNNPKSNLLNDVDSFKRKFSIKQAIRIDGLLEYIGEPYKLSDYPHPMTLTIFLPLGKLLAARYRKYYRQIHKS